MWWNKKKQEENREMLEYLFSEIEEKQEKIKQLECKLNRIHNLCSFGELEKMERIKEICEEIEDPSMNKIRQGYGLDPITKHERS